MVINMVVCFHEIVIVPVSLIRVKPSIPFESHGSFEPVMHDR